MMTPTELMQHILDETYIMKGAIEIEDLDVVLSALSNRENYIKVLQTLTFDPKESTLQALWREYEAVEKTCNTLMYSFKDKIHEEYTGSKVQYKNMVKTKNVHDRYQLQTKEFLSGHALDQKK